MERVRVDMPPLERRRVLDRAWERFVEDGVEPRASPRSARSWRRAREDLGVDPTSLRLHGVEVALDEREVLLAQDPFQLRAAAQRQSPHARERHAGSE
jgi:hypothetical protein